MWCHQILDALTRRGGITGRTALMDAAGVSISTLDRHMKFLLKQKLASRSRVTKGGHKKYRYRAAATEKQPHAEPVAEQQVQAEFGFAGQPQPGQPLRAEEQAQPDQSLLRAASEEFVSGLWKDTERNADIRKGEILNALRVVCDQQFADCVQQLAVEVEQGKAIKQLLDKDVEELKKTIQDLETEVKQLKVQIAENQVAATFLQAVRASMAPQPTQQMQPMQPLLQYP
jgi:FtsZ-binding cell division protein ZapB